MNNRFINFFKRNIKEVFRDPIIYIFCLGFPVVMFVMFQIINRYSQGNTAEFELYSLLPGIMMFSYTFVMLTMGLLVSKDRQTMFLKRLFSSPMKSYEFILGYAVVGIIVGLGQSVVCVLTGLIISLISNVPFIPFHKILLLIISQLPILLTMVFGGILFGTVFNDKAAPGVSSAFITLAGMLGGCWMPVGTMGDFEVFCRFLPFYPSVYIGRVITSAPKMGFGVYTFDKVAALGFIPLMLFMVATIVLSVICFKNSMVSDK